MAIYQKPNTSKPHSEHRVYPYLREGIDITKPNQVWCVDVTYIPMRRGFLYLVAIMDSNGRWMDKIMIERLWRSLKYECVYLHAFETGGETSKGIEKWIKRYNEERPHSSLDDKTPYEAYYNLPRAGYPVKLAA